MEALEPHPSHCYRTLHLAFHRATRLSSLLPMQGHAEAVRILLAAGADVNAKGQVSLHHEFRVLYAAGHASDTNRCDVMIAEVAVRGRHSVNLACIAVAPAPAPSNAMPHIGLMGPPAIRVSPPLPPSPPCSSPCSLATPLFTGRLRRATCPSCRPCSGTRASTRGEEQGEDAGQGMGL